METTKMKDYLKKRRQPLKRRRPQNEEDLKKMWCGGMRF